MSLVSWFLYTADEFGQMVLIVSAYILCYMLHTYYQKREKEEGNSVYILWDLRLVGFYCSIPMGTINNSLIICHEHLGFIYTNSVQMG